MVCGLIVNTMLAAAPEMLDLPAGQPLQEQEMTENFVQQLQVVLLGAATWRAGGVLVQVIYTAGSGLNSVLRCKKCPHLCEATPPSNTPLTGHPLAVVQWIERPPPKRQMWVRFPPAGPCFMGEMSFNA